MKSFKYYVSYCVAKIKGKSQTESDLNAQRQRIRKFVKAKIKENAKYKGINQELAVDLIMQRIQENQQDKLNHEALDEGKSEQNTFTTEMSRTEQKCRDLKANLAKCKALIEKEIQSSRLRSSVQYSYVPRLQKVSGMSTMKSDHNESSQSLANKEDNLHLQCQRREPQLLASVKEDKWLSWFLGQTDAICAKAQSKLSQLKSYNSSPKKTRGRPTVKKESPSSTVLTASVPQKTYDKKTNPADQTGRSQVLADRECNPNFQCHRRKTQLPASFKEDKADSLEPKRAQTSTIEEGTFPREVSPTNSAVDLESEETQSSNGLSREGRPENKNTQNKAALEIIPAKEAEVQTLCREKEANSERATKRKLSGQLKDKENNLDNWKEQEGKRGTETSQTNWAEQRKGQKRGIQERQHPWNQEDCEKDICQLKRIRRSSAKKAMKRLK